MAFDSSENPQRGSQSAQVSVPPLKVGRGRVGIPRNFRVLKEGENRTLDFLPQKTMTRLEVSGQFLANASKPDSRSR